MRPTDDPRRPGFRLQPREEDGRHWSRLINSGDGEGAYTATLRVNEEALWMRSLLGKDVYGVWEGSGTHETTIAPGGHDDLFLVERRRGEAGVVLVARYYVPSGGVVREVASDPHATGSAKKGRDGLEPWARVTVTLRCDPPTDRGPRMTEDYLMRPDGVWRERRIFYVEKRPGQDPPPATEE